MAYHWQRHRVEAGPFKSPRIGSWSCMVYSGAAAEREGSEANSEEANVAWWPDSWGWPLRRAWDGLRLRLGLCGSMLQITAENTVPAATTA